MSEPIYLPVIDGDCGNQIVEITPDLARQIVALALADVCHPLNEHEKRIAALEAIAKPAVCHAGPLSADDRRKLERAQPVSVTELHNAKPQPVADDAADSADVLTMLAEMTLERDKALAQRDTARAELAAERERREKVERERDALRKQIVPDDWCYLDSCPHCGCDVHAEADSTDKDGNRIFVDGEDARCTGCGLPGQVSCDSETAAHFEAFDRTWEVDAARAQVAALEGLLRDALAKGNILRNGVRQVAANGPPDKAWRIQGEHFAAEWDQMETRIDAALAGKDKP